MFGRGLGVNVFDMRLFNLRRCYYARFIGRASAFQFGSALFHDITCGSAGRFRGWRRTVALRFLCRRRWLLIARLELIKLHQVAEGAQRFLAFFHRFAKRHQWFWFRLRSRIVGTLLRSLRAPAVLLTPKRLSTSVRRTHVAL